MVIEMIRSLSPSVIPRTPIELRRFKSESLFPTDTPAALLQRAQAAGSLHHPHLVTLLDAGQVTYKTVCEACHQPDGRGREKLAPSLVGSELALAAPGISLKRNDARRMSGVIRSCYVCVNSV